MSKRKTHQEAGHMERGLNTRCLHLEETEGKLEHYGAIMA